jgi:uncharacterized protein (DUF697 family)/tellurite resistance protein
MNIEEQKSILVVALYAAFADGVKDEREHEQIRSIAASLADSAAATDLAPLYQDVLLKRVSLEAAAARLTDPGQRQLAYEMAVCMCDADGRQSEPERHFLTQLKKLLQLHPERSAAFDREADTIVELGEAAAPAVLPVPAAPDSIKVAQVPEGDLDQSILKYALLNGALELLPQSWASLAIIPLQIKMVYGVGKAHGIELDQGHVKEFIAAAGVGLTSQYLEQFGRKLLGGLLGKAAGKSFGNAGASATGMAFSFATTYALGQVAKRYYAGGRTMSTAVLRDTFQNLLEPAKQMQAQYLPQIRREAETLDMGRVMSMVRGA